MPPTIISGIGLTGEIFLQTQANPETLEMGFEEFGGALEIPRSRTQGASYRREPSSQSTPALDLCLLILTSLQVPNPLLGIGLVVPLSFQLGALGGEAPFVTSISMSPALTLCTVPYPS